MPPPHILSFTVQPNAITVGGTVTVRWDTDAATVTIDELTGTGTQITPPLKVAPKGERNFVVGVSNSNAVLFRLSASRGDLTDTQAIEVTVQCPSLWFFQPSPQGCPPQPAQSSTFYFQTFQNGMAFYVPNTDTLYFLANNGQVASYHNQWNPAITLPPVAVPAGFTQPVGQIGYTWSFQPWLDGRPLVATFGYGIGQLQVYGGTYQPGQIANTIYLRGPDNNVYGLLLSQGSWGIVGIGQ